MEFETYEEVIDSYNSGVGVEAGETLTDYIKRNNIKIKDPMEDFEKIFGKKSMEKEGIETIKMDMASGPKDMNIEIEEVVKEFIRMKGRRPNSIEEIKDFYFNEMTDIGGPSNRDNVKMAYNPGDYDPMMVEMYEQYKYDMQEQRPGMPVMDIDEFIRMERSSIATGGLAGIIGA